MAGGNPSKQEERAPGLRLGSVRIGRHVLAVCLFAAVLVCAVAPALAALLEAERDAPVYSDDQKVIATVPRGTTVELLLARDAWCKVRYTPAKGDPVEGWSRASLYHELPEAVEALRDTPLLDEKRREIAVLHQGDRAQLLEVQVLHLRVQVEAAGGDPVEGLVRKADMVDARVADFARQVKEGFEGIVHVRHAAGFEQHRTKTFGKEKTVVEIVSRSETVWLDVILASKVPVSGIQIKYQIFKAIADPAGQSRVVEAKNGVLTPGGRIEARPVTFPTQFAKFAWEDQIVSPDQPAVGKRGPDLKIGEYYHGYRVQVFWRGFLLALFEENAPPVEQG